MTLKLVFSFHPGYCIVRLNQGHEGQENVKYLPNVKLGTNIVADPDLESAGTLSPITSTLSSLMLPLSLVHFHETS